MGERTKSEEKSPQKRKEKPRSAVILAGGKGRRMGIVEKALLEFEGKTILEHLLENLFHVVDEVILSVRNPAQKEKFSQVVEKFSDREISFCFDTVENAGPLEGIRTGLIESRSEYSFVCAVDMPFVNFRVVDLLFEKASGHEAALPKWEDGKFEPLHAVYSKKLILEIEKVFERERHSVLTPVFELKDLVFVKISEIKELDPELKTFVNINTVEDLESMIRSGVEKANRNKSL